MRGWTPVFYLYGGIESAQGGPREDYSPKEYLQLLAAASFEDYDEQDVLGWTSMHRAAIHGTAADVRALLSVNASPSLKTKRLQWTPIFMSIYYGNVGTFKELANSYPEYVQERDLRGWSALHVAAGAGDSEIISLLLKAGADVHAMTEPTTYLVPMTLSDRGVTPAEVAWDAGPEAYMTFVAAVVAFDSGVQIVEEEGVDEMFWNAEENIED